MNKKEKNKLILLIFLLIFMFISNRNLASTSGTVYIDSNKDSYIKGDEIDITVNIEKASTAAFTAFISFDNTKLEYISGPDNINVKENYIIYVWYDEEGGKNAKNELLGTFKFRAKESGIVTFTINGEYYTADGQLIKTNFVEKKIQIDNNSEKITNLSDINNGTDTDKSNTNLKDLRLNTEGLVPIFQKDIYEYYLVINKNQSDIDISATAENPKALIQVTGNTNLKIGENIINVIVTSEDKTKTKNYKIYVTKTDNIKKANTNLETLAVENILLNPPFDNSITEYDIEISNKLNRLNILAIPENEKAKVSIYGNNNLKEGNNRIKINVTAENGTTKKIYNINAYKRNDEEEKEYIEEKEKNKEELEEAYNIEYTINKNDSDKIHKNKSGIILMAIFFILVLMLIIFVYKKYKITK